jgi:hypothetical protein
LAHPRLTWNPVARAGQTLSISFRLLSSGSERSLTFPEVGGRREVEHAASDTVEDSLGHDELQGCPSEGRREEAGNEHDEANPHALLPLVRIASEQGNDDEREEVGQTCRDGSDQRQEGRVVVRPDLLAVVCSKHSEVDIVSPFRLDTRVMPDRY